MPESNWIITKPNVVLFISF